MYRCIIIDDEPLALNVLADYVQQTDGLQLVDITTNPVVGLQRVLNGEADLVLLDIEMPGVSGIEFMKQAGDNCKIILTTAYPGYAIDGFENNAVDYLLKPISFERFTRAIKKLGEGPAMPTRADYIFVKSEYKLLRIDFTNILYLESLRDYVAIHTIDKRKILTLQSLSFFEKELPASLFARIHKSYIVRLEKITVVERNKIHIGLVILPVGDRWREGFLNKVKRG